MYRTFYSPNIISIASSHVGEDSLSVSDFTRVALLVIEGYGMYIIAIFFETVALTTVYT